MNNKLMVEFDFIIDMDLAIFKFIKDKYSNSIYINKDIININNENEIIYRLISRKDINPLSILFPDYNTDKMYKDIIDNHYKELLSYATAYDTFGLMITFLNNASSIDINVICKSNLECEFIKKLNPRLKTLLINKESDLKLSSYTVMYVKYISSLFKYKNIEGKHIYIPAANYNMDEESDSVNEICCLFADINIIHLIDLYTKIKFRFKNNHNDDSINEKNVEYLMGEVTKEEQEYLDNNIDKISIPTDF